MELGHRVGDLEITVGEHEVILRGDPKKDRKDQGLVGDVGELMKFLGGFKKLMWITAGSSVSLTLGFFGTVIYFVVKYG